MSQSLPNPHDVAQPSETASVEAGPNPPVASPLVGHVVARPTTGRGISNRALNVLLGGALVLAVAGIAFAAGRLTAPAATITPASFPGGTLPGGGVFNGNANGNGPGQVRGSGQVGIIGGGAGPTIEGTVESVTDTTLTLKTADGQIIQIALGDGTTYHAQTDASARDVVTGSKVLVRLDFSRLDGNGPQPTAGTAGGPPAGGGMTADDVTVVP